MALQSTALKLVKGVSCILIKCCDGPTLRQCLNFVPHFLLLVFSLKLSANNNKNGLK